MKRFKLTLEYDGTCFCGLQRQNGVKTVQQTIEEAAFKATSQRITLHSAGRTDSGVHAFGQVSHFECSTSLSDFKMKQALNHFIKEEGVCVIACEEVNKTFHARFSAKWRRYEYLILNRRSSSPLYANRMWHVIAPLDTDLMKQAALNFLGTHDFSSFRSAHCQSPNAIRTLDDLTITQEKDIIKLEIQSKSFLHNQVRIMVGTLVQVGKKRCEPSYICDLLEKKDRTISGPTAPSYGLYFHSVGY